MTLRIRDRQPGRQRPKPNGTGEGSYDNVSIFSMMKSSLPQFSSQQEQTQAQMNTAEALRVSHLVFSWRRGKLLSFLGGKFWEGF